MKFQFLLSFICLALISVACRKEGPVKEFVVKEVEKPVLGKPEWTPNTKPKEDPLEKLTGIERGQYIYQNVCTQCHNKDPNKDGSVGPVMVDAPVEVMRSKVMTGKYPDQLPPGFVPKRKTRAMRPLPHLENEVSVIHAWVQSVKKK